MEASSVRRGTARRWAGAWTRGTKAVLPTDIRPRDVVRAIFGSVRKEKSMNLNELAKGLSGSGRYSAEFDSGIVRVRNLESESEYVVEGFGESLQVRQAVCFDCLKMTDSQLSALYLVCSMVNARFSGCKSYVDNWGALLTGSDILAEVATTRFVEIILDQVEFVSLGMLELVEMVRTREGPVTLEDVDSALVAPSLQ
jgi:hypothetical protein